MIIAVRLMAEDCGVPGLAAHKATNGIGWMLTHVRSGLAIARFEDADCADDLLGAARALADLTDWTKSGADIHREVKAAQVNDAVIPHGGEIPLFAPRAVREDWADIDYPPVTQADIEAERGVPGLDARTPVT